MTRVRTWRFKPATCDGEPIPAEMATGLPPFKRVLSLQLLHRFAPDALESLGVSQ